MRLVVLSDTHNHHRNEKFPEIPKGDILIHSGDATRKGTLESLKDFFDWFSSLPHPYKIFVAGNHDIGLDPEFIDNRRIGSMSEEGLSQKAKETSLEAEKLIPDNIIYLKDSFVEIEDPGMFRKLKIYGSPYTPRFCNWAFLCNRGEAIAEKWALIPDDIDILVTHGPAYGHGDVAPPWILSQYPRIVGCMELLKRIIQIKPKVHVFGHIHSGHGIYQSDEMPTTFMNAAICTEEYAPTNKPLTLDLDAL